LVANLVDADALLILTDQDGMYDADPRRVPDARRIDIADVNDSALDSMVGEGGAFGRGGMVTKLRAARLAARSGTLTVIASGRDPNVVSAVASGASMGTFLSTDKRPQSARKQWLASLQHARGTLLLDAGAVAVVTDQGRSLLPIGIVGVDGEFVRGDLVRCVDNNGREIARGLVNYPAAEARRLAGKASAAIESILGYGGPPEMIHRDNMVCV
jgi:glutamate 5-kinase